MRVRLVDATIDLLVERGWAGMSTNDVVHRARVSRGALTHHFPSKAALMDAAAERLIGQRAADFATTFRLLPPEGRTIDAALDLLWSYFRGPTFSAVLELIVAARTNDELRTAISDAPERVVTESLSLFEELFPDAAASPNAVPGLRLALTLMTGLAVEQILRPERTEHAEETIGWIKAMARSFGIGPAPVEAPA
jgi:AcrR family transcriptional regulator